MDAKQFFGVFVKCKCGEMNVVFVDLPMPLNPMDSDCPVREAVEICRCDCGRSATVRVTAEATPNQAWAKEAAR